MSELLDGLDAGREALRRFLVGEDDLATMETKIVRLATDTIPGVDHASITMLRDGAPVTTGSTGSVASALDAAQYAAGDGPCLAAIRHRGVEVVCTPVDERYPDFAAEARARGVLSSLSVPLGNEETVVGGLNLYSEGATDFDEHAQELAGAFADQLGVAAARARHFVEAAELVEQLRQAMESRAVIEQAKGVVMTARRRGPDDAFQVLVQASQNRNRKLREIAAEIVERYRSGERNASP